MQDPAWSPVSRRRGKQLIGYLDKYGLKKGYMLTFSFNKTKSVGVETRFVDGKFLVEAVV